MLIREKKPLLIHWPTTLTHPHKDTVHKKKVFTQFWFMKPCLMLPLCHFLITLLTWHPEKSGLDFIRLSDLVITTGNTEYSTILKQNGTGQASSRASRNYKTFFEFLIGVRGPDSGKRKREEEPDNKRDKRKQKQTSLAQDMLVTEMAVAKKKDKK